jgi:carbonic anhydrase
VPGNDLNVLSVLEYVVGHLGVTDIIVNGHYSCRAVKAATSRQDLGTLENWLRLIRDVYRLHKDYLDLIKDPEQLHRTLVELNVIEQCLNVYKTGVVQRKRAQTRKELQDAGKSKQEVQDGIFPRIHGMVFNPEGGNLRILPINFDKRVGSLDHIYGLYEKPSY